MPLSPSDYKNIKLDKETRAQLFQLFIEGKLAEFDTIFTAQNEALKALRNDMNDSQSESKRSFHFINESINFLEKEFIELKTNFELKIDNKPKTFWDFFK